METELEPISVSVRTRLAAAKADCRRCSSWPPMAPVARCHAVGFFDLAENLRLADHHGVEARGHAEEMTDGVSIVVPINVRSKQRGLKAELAIEETGEIGGGRLDDREHLDAIAGGDDHALGDSGHGGEGAGDFGELLAGDGDALAQLDGRGFVVDADEYEGHGAPNRWTWLT